MGPRRVTSTPLPMGGAGGETASTGCGTGGRNATTAVREGILLPVVPEYESPGAHLDSLFGRDVPFGDDVPMRLFGDDDDSFAVEINHSFAAQRHHGSTTSSAPPASLSFSHLGGESSARSGTMGGASSGSRGSDSLGMGRGSHPASSCGSVGSRGGAPPSSPWGANQQAPHGSTQGPQGFSSGANPDQFLDRQASAPGSHHGVAIADPASHLGGLLGSTPH